MQQRGVIQPSASAWASPIVIVPKKDGSHFCVDIRRVNAVTKKDVYPLQRIDDILDTLSGAQYLSTLDLSSGYWQIELDPSTRDKTAFTSHCGLYEFTRMPFGLCNAQATFQRLMQVPTDVTKLRQFLGLASSYRRFINGFAKIAHPLYQLLKKGVKFEADSLDTLQKERCTVPSADSIGGKVCGLMCDIIVILAYLVLQERELVNQADLHSSPLK